MTPGGRAEEKRSFYRRTEVAAAYDAQRFGGRSGAYVNEREGRAVLELLPPGGTVVDVACGTGRVHPLLRERAERLVGLDASLPMLAGARGRGADLLAAGDAFRLPIADGAADTVVALRFLFHFDDLAPLLAELRRITRPGGTLVCDTASWSPRSLLPLDRGRWGARVATIRPSTFRSLAGEAGWRANRARPAFLGSPYLYRRLPLPVARKLESLERALPARLRCRVYWALQAV
jgi:SAM-dependent methyltransferase